LRAFGFLFGSELKAILVYRCPRSLNYQALEIFCFGYPLPKTMFWMVVR